MAKRLTIDNVLTELKEIKPTVETGYPYYNVPQTVRRAISLFKKLRKVEKELQEIIEKAQKPKKKKAKRMFRDSEGRRIKKKLMFIS